MAKHKVNSQPTLILNHLKSGREITPMEALSLYDVFRLGAIIFTLKKDGHNISTRIERHKTKTGKRSMYAVYKLEEAHYGI